MKKLLLLLAGAALLLTGCDKYDDGDIRKEIGNLKDRIAALESTVSAMNGDVSSLKTLVNALDGRDYVTGIEALEDGSGYKIKFSVAPAITVKNGTDGTDGDSAPVIGLREDTDGVYYWTLTSDGEPEWLLDADGNKMPVSGKDGESGFAPKIGVDDEGFWTVDHGNGPERVLDTAGDPISALGSKGGSFFTDVTHTASTITFTFEDGTGITLKRQTTPPAVTLSITDADAGVNIVLVGAPSVFTLSQENVSSLTVIKPEGWQATVSGDVLTVTAPDPLNRYAELDGTVTLIGLSASGQAATASMTVGAGITYTRGDGSFLDVLVKNPSKVKPNFDNSGDDIYLDKDGDGLILLSDAARVKYIYVFDQRLTSLSGLEYFPALESLNCGNNNLTGTLDVSGCVNLRKLYCYYTQLDKLDVSGLTNLQTLYCNTNPNLSELNVSGLTNLQTLYCYDTKLEKLDVSGCENLQTLHCHLTKLDKLDVSGCENLQTLHCHLTKLDKLDVSGLFALRWLECGGNANLSTLDVSGCVNLQDLRCYNTDLSTLDVSDCVNLQGLYCSNTEIDALDVSKCTVLTKLQCGKGGDSSTVADLTVTVANGTDLTVLKITAVRIVGGSTNYDAYGTTPEVIKNGVKVVKAP